jgi:hypothetical protein
MQKITQVAIFCALLISGLVETAAGQLLGTERRYVRVGPLQSFFASFGRERAFNNTYYEGLIWPADYSYQDNAVINCIWLGCTDFVNRNGKTYAKYAFPLAIDENVGLAIFPLEIRQIAKFETPSIYVDGNDITAIYSGDVDEINPDQVADRVIINRINTSMGLSMKREIYYFTQQYHNNYFLKVFTFTNTGNTDYDDEIELTAPLKNVRISTGVRYSVSREGAMMTSGTQQWGQQTWVTKRGEDYAAHAGEVLTEASGSVQWLRSNFAWAGQKKEIAWDCIGAPDVSGDGRLCAPQHAGNVIIHVDKSAADKSDDPNQPMLNGWHAADAQTFFSTGLMTDNDISNMGLLYDMTAGTPLSGLGGRDRYDEKYMASYPDAFTVHNDAGGTHIWVCYGPWNLAHGESITIVEAEGVAGLSRTMCEEIGRRWKKAYLNASDTGPFTLPNGATTTSKDEYKDKWVYTGKDSILLTFSRAKRNFDSGFKIPQPPLPPAFVEVKSGGDMISVSWGPSASESAGDFGGYKVFRAIGRSDTVFTEIYSGGPGSYSYNDKEATRGQAYYYYVVAYNDGSNNSEGLYNPTGPLYSSKFYGLASEPAYLRRQAGGNLANIRVVPNPYDIRSRNLQYVGEDDKLMFLNIPGHCTIRIFTERGDLINTIQHEDGSGDESWNSITSSRQVVVSGIYIVHFEVTQDFYDPATNQLLYKKGEKAFRKLVIIR